MKNDIRLNEKALLELYGITAFDGPYGVLIADARTRNNAIVFANDAALSMTGYVHEELLDRGIDSLWESKELHGGFGGRARMRPDLVDTIVMLRRKDGGRLWIHLFTRPLQSDVGQVTHFVCFLLDVTEAANVKVALLSVLADRQAILENSPDVIFLLSDDGTIQEAGLSVEKILGRTPDELQGKSILGIFPEDRREFVRQDLVRINEGNKIRSRREYLSRGGQPVVIDWFASQVKGGGILCIGRDATRELMYSSQLEYFRLARNMRATTSERSQGGELGGARTGQATRMSPRAGSVATNGIRLRQRARWPKREAILLSADLELAIEREELFLLYQPRLSLLTENIVGVKVLVRWRHPQGGLLLPRDFLGSAEKTAQLALARWVMNRALLDMHHWVGEADDTFGLSLSLHACQFGGQPSSAMALLELPQRIHSSRLEIEVKEETIIADVEASKRSLSNLRDGGIGVALGEFGLNQSNLTYLTEIPINSIKIHPMLLVELQSAGKRRTRMLLAMIFALCRSLGVRSVCDGVQSRTVRDTLVDLGCDQIEGPLVGSALTAQELVEFFRGGKRRK